MREFAPNPRAHPHTYAERVRRAVNAAPHTLTNANSGFRDGLRRTIDILTPLSLGERAFGPLLEARERRLQLSPHDQRALTIRDHILGMIEDANYYIAPYIQTWELPLLEERIHGNARELIRLGVVPRMHAEDSPEKRRSETDPLRLAEFVGGQELALLGYSVDENHVSPEGTPIIHRNSNIGDIFLVAASSLFVEIPLAPQLNFFKRFSFPSE